MARPPHADPSSDPGTAPGPPGWEVAVELLRASSALIDALHNRLPDLGHGDARPAHGYALQAILAGADTASALGKHLGTTKQAAGQLADELVRIGYAERGSDPSDGRRRPLHVTDRGRDLLARSAAIFDELRDAWAAELSPGALGELTATLRAGTAAFGGTAGLRPTW
jgi:DNA-binding MarR family transcriptional regulator